MIDIAINGAAGRMGRRFVDLVTREEDMQVTAALEAPGHPDLGRDAGEVAGIGPIGVPITAEWTGGMDVLMQTSDEREIGDLLGRPDVAETDKAAQDKSQ